MEGWIPTVRRGLIGAALLAVSAILNSCSDDNASANGRWPRSFTFDEGANVFSVQTPGELAGIPTFYQKYASAHGLPILASSMVPDEALRRAWSQALAMLEGRGDILRRLAKNGVTVAVMGRFEVTTDLPEHADLEPWWNQRARGLGATPGRPVSSAAEENLLCLPGDKYSGENIFIHEFAHTIHLMALRYIDSEFDSRLTKVFQNAQARGLWQNHYAGTNSREYWAEGVQSYFSANRTHWESPGIVVNRRDQLAAYDPLLHDLIADTLLTSWRGYVCN